VSSFIKQYLDEQVNAQELCKLNNAPYEKESTGSVNVNSIKSALNGIRSVIASLMSESNQNDKDFNGMKIFVAVTDGPHASFFSSVNDLIISSIHSNISQYIGVCASLRFIYV
jgi:hypothetical protein